jgi:hypothetical protein
MKIIKWLLGPLLIPLVIASVLEARLLFVEQLSFGLVRWLAIGAAVALFLPLLIGEQNWHFLQVVEHELTHLFCGVLTQRQAVDLRIFPEENQRYFQSRGYFSSGFLSDLAPYYLPLFSLPFLAVRACCNARWCVVLEVLIGFTLSFFLLRVLRELRPYQTDLQRHTVLFSFLVVILLNLFIAVLSLALLVGDWTLVPTYMRQVLERAQLYYGTMFVRLQEAELWEALGI